jgi:inositol transport system substrate-binding protein
MKLVKMSKWFLSVGLIAVFLVGCGAPKAVETQASGGQGDKATAGAAATASGSAKKNIVIGAAMPIFDDKWLSYLYDAINKYDKEHDDVEVTMVDAKNDSGKQLSQVETFVTQKVDVIVINPVETEAVEPMLDVAGKAKIPVVIVNRAPSDKVLEKAYAYVGSESLQAGTLQMEKVVELLKSKGKDKANIAIMNGTLGQESVVKRTEGNKKVLSKYPDMKIVREQTANYQRSEGMSLMENWIQAGDKIDAVVANNDEMAIGSIMALEAAGKLKDVFVAGVDGTIDALDYVKQGKLNISVFQDATGQGQKAIETAVKAAHGEKLDNKMVWVPFELVTKDNVETYIQKWNKK